MCKCGLQKWVTVEVMGVPFMVCSHCGEGLPKAVVDKNYTQREMDEWQKPKPKPRPFKEEMLETAKRIWEEKHGSESNPRR